MCTAITYQTNDFYFGRTLDHDRSYREQVVITPRNMPLSFRHVPSIEHHYAMIGMAYVSNDYPLYYDAVNEKGVGIAGLNFPEHAAYYDPDENCDNIAQFEWIPWILAQCANVREVRELLKHTNVVRTAFRDDLPPAKLHWMIADRHDCIVVECMEEGMMIHDNPIGILTNEPPFPFHLYRIHDFMHLSSQSPTNQFDQRLPLKPYSLGMGAIGLPGDLSSVSRFIRAAFVKSHAISDADEIHSVNQFFHILQSVEQVRGCNEVTDDTYEMTIYSGCCNANQGIYYYTTYEDHQIHAIHMHHVNLNDDSLFIYDLSHNEHIHEQN